MQRRKSLVGAAVTLVMIGLGSAVWAVDMGGMKQKVETVKGQAENVKKEGWRNRTKRQGSESTGCDEECRRSKG